MKVLKSQNDEFVFGQIMLLGERFRERRAKHRQLMLRNHLDERPNSQDSINGRVTTILERAHRLFVA